MVAAAPASARTSSSANGASPPITGTATGTRTIKEALAQCNKPYVIDKGPNGGVMMYLADQQEKSELVLKAGKDGVTYLGPPGAAGTADDREISNIDANSFTTIWVDPDNAGALWHHGVRALRQERA